MRKILGILGPTAIGKSDLALSLAQRLETDIITADSAQIYKGMNIGTAKPDENVRGIVRHHMIDLIDPDEYFNAYMFSSEAENIIESFPEGKVGLIAGGTGLYFEALLFGLDFEVNERTMKIRHELKTKLNDEGEDAVYQELCSLDPVSAKTIHPHNVKSVMRAIEIFKTSGTQKTSASDRCRIKKFPFKLYVVNTERPALYESINERVDRMVALGLFEEIEALLKLFPPDSRGFSAIGYKEIIEYFKGNCSKQEAISSIKQHTRNYAKRQLTFFKRLPALWVEKTETNKLCKFIIKDFYATEF